MDTKIFEKLNETYNKFVESGSTLYKDSEKIIKECLKEHNGVCVLNPEDDEYVSVSYDGGNHPEYASNLYSNVNKVWLSDDGDIRLSIEDTDEYYFDCIQNDEAYYIAIMMKYHNWGWTEDEKC